jgi:hypothetical protein
MNKLSIYNLVFFAVLALTLSSCEAIGDIFKAGFWVGVIAVVIVIGLIIWVIKSLF